MPWDLVVTIAAVAFALGCALWAHLLTRPYRGPRRSFDYWEWRRKDEEGRARDAAREAGER